MPNGEPAGGVVETPAELLANNVVLTPSQVARVIGDFYTKGAHKGQPKPEKVRDRIRSGALQAVDPFAPSTHWVVAVAEVERFLADGPRRAVAA